MNEAIMLLLLVFLVVSSVSCTEKIGNSAKLKACAKQHNVYECELVAVPKVGE